MSQLKYCMQCMYIRYIENNYEEYFALLIMVQKAAVS